jgi:pimeloyl-ACP methyl ester carboxylesterase
MSLWFDNALLVFLIATLTVAGVPGCGQRNIQGDARNATAESQDRFFDSDGVRIRYAVTGSEGAEPIVFINGFPERLEVWSGIAASGSLKGYRLIRFDPRGLGLSDKPHDQKEYGKEMVEDVVRLLDHLKIRKAHVVGYSMGAWITLKLVATHPERVKTATLGGNAGLHPSQAARQQIIADAIEGKDIAAGVMNLTLPNGSKLSEGEAKETERVLLAVGRRYATDLDPKAVAPMMRGFAELVVADEELKNNYVPALALYSNENDIGRPLAGEITALSKRMPNVSLAQIKDAIHGNARSMSQFAESLAEFLAKHAAPGR